MGWNWGGCLETGGTPKWMVESLHVENLIETDELEVHPILAFYSITTNSTHGWNVDRETKMESSSKANYQ